jgi:hypothetical protein
MFDVFNMGLGFCYGVDPPDASVGFQSSSSTAAWRSRIGTAVSDPRKIVRIPARGLAGHHKRFWREDRTARRVG